MSPKKIALWFLIASVGASALLGIVIVLAGSFSDLQVRVILTTLTISAASICALASGALWESRRTMLLPLPGAILALVAASLVIAGIWKEPESDQFWKFTVSVGLLAVATAHACLLSLARLARRFIWARVVTLAAVYLLAGLFIFVIYFTPKGDNVIRILGAISIIAAAFTILTPIFHRLSRGDLDEDGTVQSDHRLPATITCPRCGSAHPNSLTETKCNRCGCRFIVTILAEAGSGGS